MKAETAFNPDQTNALLDMLDIDDVAMCATNRYAVEEMDDTTTLTCDQFGDFGCMSKNDDLLPMLTKANGACGSTTYLPTMFPSEYMFLVHKLCFKHILIVYSTIPNSIISHSVSDCVSK